MVVSHFIAPHIIEDVNFFNKAPHGDWRHSLKDKVHHEIRHGISPAWLHDHGVSAGAGDEQLMLPDVLVIVKSEAVRISFAHTNTWLCCSTKKTSEIGAIIAK
jgi:hypothetical protein